VNIPVSITFHNGMMETKVAFSFLDIWTPAKKAELKIYPFKEKRSYLLRVEQL